MSKFLMLSARIGVNDAARKLFAERRPNDAEYEHLLEKRGELSLSTLLAWHKTGDERAPRREVIDHLRRGDSTAWMEVTADLKVPPDRLRDWLVECADTTPEATWIEAALTLASTIAQKILLTLRDGDRVTDAMAPPPDDPRFRRLLVEREHDRELVAVLTEWLRSCDDELRCQYLCLLDRAGVLGEIDDIVRFLPNDVVPEWPPPPINYAPPVRGEHLPLANVAHWLALRVPESARAEADAWIVAQYINAARNGARWIDLFYRIPPRLRPDIAIASLDLEPSQWSPFAGRALAQRINAGEQGLWPRAMRWLEYAPTMHSDAETPPIGHAALPTFTNPRWSLRDHCVRKFCVDRFPPVRSPTWLALRPVTACRIGPLFVATAADGAETEDGLMVLPAEDGILCLELASLYEVIGLTRHVPLEDAPDGELLLRCSLDDLLAWREAAGPAFDDRIDTWLDHHVATDPSSTTLNHALLLGRPLRDEWKRRWRAALRTWRFADVLSLHESEGWLANDEELVALCLARLDEEGESVFHSSYLPECLLEIIEEHVASVEDVLPSLGPMLSEGTRLTPYLPLEHAPDGERLLRCSRDDLLAWREAVGPAFDDRIDTWLDHHVAADPSSTTLNHARLLGRPLCDEWKRRWRAALRTWRFADVLSLRAREGWLANDEELVALCLARLHEEGESVFHSSQLPECLRAISEEHVASVEDDYLASELLTWLGRSDPKGTVSRALQRLRASPGHNCCEWWADRLSSTQKWNDHGADVFEALVGTGDARRVDLAWHLIEWSRWARDKRVADEGDRGKNGRPRKQPDELKFIAAIHLALATALCRLIVQAIDRDAVGRIDALANAVSVLEPPPLIMHELESVLRALRQTGIAPAAQQTLDDLKQIARGAWTPQAAYEDLRRSLQFAARSAESQR